MEKKPTSTLSGVSKQVIKSLNRAYVVEPIKDLNRINELMSDFISGEIDKIENILNSDEMLNFKDSIGQTLIHAILKNESPNVTEQYKLNVIQNLVDKKNVSINSMDERNQNALHLACQKGYVDIIKYLLNNNCEQTLVDNYGNAPLHYLMDKFILECKQDDFYKDINRDTKLGYSDDIKKIRDIMKYQSFIILFEIFNGISEGKKKYEVIKGSEEIINSLKNFIKYKTQFEIETIYELISSKILEINKLFLDPTASKDIKFEKAKTIILDSVNDIKKIYDYNLETSQTIDEVIFNFKINDKKNNHIKNIKQNLENIKINIISINVEKDKIINQSYNELQTYVCKIFFILNFVYDNYNLDKKKVKGIDQPILLLEYDPLGNISYLPNSLYTGNNKKRKIRERRKKIVEENLTNINNILFENFLIPYDPPTKKFNVFINGVEDNDIADIDLVYVSDLPFDMDDFNINFSLNVKEKEELDGIPYCNGIVNNPNDGIDYYAYLIPNKSEIFFTDVLENIDFNENQDSNYINEKFLWKKNTGHTYSKYSPIRIISSFINEELLKISSMENIFLDFQEDKFMEASQTFNLFYVKNISIEITKLINNLVILEKYLDDIDIKKIIMANYELTNIFNGIHYNDELDENFRETYNKLLEVTINLSQGEIINKDGKLIKYLTEKKYKEEIESIYKKLYQTLEVFNNIILEINKYNSLYQLEKYIKFTEDFLKNGVYNNLDLINTFFNKFEFNISKKFPKNYEDYKNMYFKIKRDINLYDLGLEDLLAKNKYFLLKDGTRTNFIDPIHFIENPEYLKNFYEKVFPYLNTFNFNTFYVNTGMNNFEINYYSLNVTEDNSSDPPFKVLDKPDKIYTIDDLQFKTKMYIFSRGYDTIKNKNLEYRLQLLKHNDDINKLCDIDLIKTKSNYNPLTKSIDENITMVGTFNIENSLQIDNINFKSYIITANFNEIINLFVYIIYNKIFENPDIVKCFFLEKNNIEFKNIDKSGKINIKFKKMGINLSDYPIDDTNKKNILDTLSFISVNEKEKKDYLLENIKYFVKLITDQEIFNKSLKIIDEIKLTYPKLDTTGINPEQINIINSKIEIDDINKLLKIIESKYRVDIDEYLVNIIKNNLSSSTLQLVQITKTLIKDKTGKNNEKIIGTKCFNKKNTDELIKLDFDYKILDLNGNTILIRLIDQFNYYGVEKISESKPLLITYKNYRQETPINHLGNVMNIICSEYLEKNFNQRINKYSIALENSINQPHNEFSEISLENTFELVKEILTNCIYLFNEVLWLKLYDYPNGWGLSEKKKLIDVLNIKKEILLINTFGDDTNDMEIFIKEEKNNIETKINLYIKTLENEIIELENKKKEYNLEFGNLDNTFVNKADITDNITKLETIINEKKDTKNQYENMIKKLDVDEKSYSDKEVQKIFLNYKDNLFDLKNTSINWNNYKELVNELDFDYFRILKVLNLKPQKNNMISNFILKIFETNIINTKKDIVIFEKYFQSIYDNLFADYWDLDKYEDSDYNSLNNSIIEILKINVIGIIKIELINMITNYISQVINTYLSTSNINELSEKINKIKNNNKLLNSIDSYLFTCLITKLDLKNPNKTNYLDIDTEKKKIIGQIELIIGFVFDETDKIRIDKIMEFQRYISDNIGFNCFDEIKKILLDGKKISIYYKILNILQKYLPK